VDKLARLMPGLPQYIEPQRLADVGGNIAGRLRIDDMRRLADLLLERAGTVTFRLEFSLNEQGSVRIEGEYATTLAVLCQRCLEPLELDVAGPIDVILDDLLPALVDDRLHVSGFVEDEVLLGLPLAPMHGAGQCPANIRSGQADAAEAGPFAVLAELKTAKD
jgi:uncharacterized protein